MGKVTFITAAYSKSKSPSHTWKLFSSGKYVDWQFTKLLVALNPIVEARIKRHLSIMSIMQASLFERYQSLFHFLKLTW